MSDKRNSIEQAEKITNALENGGSATIQFSQELTVEKIAEIEQAAEKAGVTITITQTATTTT